MTTSDALLPGRHELVLGREGRTRPYVLHVPPAAGVPGAPDASPVPLLVQLHGGGGGGPWYDRMTGFIERGSRDGVAVAVPEAISGLWNDGRRRLDGRGRRGGSDPGEESPDDVGYLAAVIDDVCARQPIDERRIWVVGMSNGAGMAGRLACERSERLAAVGQVAGTAALSVARGCHPGSPVPLLQVHGVADAYWRYAGGTARSLRRRIFAGRPFGAAASVDEWARLWVAANGARPDPALERLAPDTLVRTWRGPTPASDVIFYRVDGGGHTWPGARPSLPRPIFGRTSQTFSATEVIWAFVRSHARSGG